MSIPDSFIEFNQKQHKTVFGKVTPLQNTVNYPVYSKLIPYSILYLSVIPTLISLKNTHTHTHNFIALNHYWFSLELPIPCNKAVLQGI